MLVIARFNWPFYLAAAVTVSNTWGRGACLAAALGAGYFLVGSLGVSHLVYDRSDLYRLGWLERALHGAKRGRMACCHAGYDDISAALRERSGAGEWLVLDHYDELRMTEASIRRARRIYPPVAGTRAAGHAAWPLDDGSLDVVFGILAIHELRSEDERAEWFGEARRCLAAGGGVLGGGRAGGAGGAHARPCEFFGVWPWVCAFPLGGWLAAVVGARRVFAGG
jgi:hypothetical protein